MKFLKSIITFVLSLFKKKQKTTEENELARFNFAPTPALKATFTDGVLDINTWSSSLWVAPGASSIHQGTFDHENVFVKDGCLGLRLCQTRFSDVYTSIGGEVMSKQKFHYGIYEFVVRASSTSSSPNGIGLPQSGSITGIFNYVTGSKTEIDFEIEGNERNNIVHMTSWIGENLSNEQSKSVLALPYPHEEFHNYKFIWIPGRIYFYINGVLHAVHSKVVPTEPAHIVINHWGTHNPNWGGLATPGVERWVWVKSVSFTPLL